MPSPLVVDLAEWRGVGVHAGFTTKHFPLVLHKTDELLDPKNQKEFRSLLKLNKFALLNQDHGDGIAVIDDAKKYSKDGFYHFPECDGAMTDLSGMTLLVFSADCLSVFFIAGPWVALIHAGWRGSQKKIAQKTLKLLLKKSGEKIENAKMIFGPCIGAEHYEVGQEFGNYFKRPSLVERDGRLFFDVRLENERQLLDAGVPAKNIIHKNICTVSQNEDYYSFRKEKEKAGRIISFISKTV